MRRIRALLGATIAGACAITALPGVAATAAEPASAATIDVTGTYYPVSPARLLDTRSGLGAPVAKLGPAGRWTSRSPAVAACLPPASARWC